MRESLRSSLQPAWSRRLEAVEKGHLRQPCHCERSEAIHHRPRNAIYSRVLMDCFVVPPRNDTGKMS